MSKLQAAAELGNLHIVRLTSNPREYFQLLSLLQTSVCNVFIIIHRSAVRPDSSSILLMKVLLERVISPLVLLPFKIVALYLQRFGHFHSQRHACTLFIKNSEAVNF